MPSDFSPAGLWPVRWMCDVSTVSPTVTGMAVKFAGDALWALSGRQFGLTTVTLRPARWYRRDTPFPDAWIAMPGSMQPPLGANTYGSTWWGWDTGEIFSGSGCTSADEVYLPAPVNAVSQVKVDGVVLATTAYRVDNNRILIRIDGNTWPTFNDLRLDDTRVGTWSVQAKFGQNIPSGAELAVGELACEYIRATQGDDCRLPRNITQIARQGVTITLPDPAEAFKSGLTGLRVADMFIKTWNPGGIKSRPRVYSVDRALPRRVGT